MSLPLGSFDRVGMVVRNLEAAMTAHAQVFGIRQFDLCEIDGRPAALGSRGKLKLELIEGSSGNDAVGEFSDRRGEGMSHAVFTLPGSDAIAALVEQAAARDIAVQADGDRLAVGRRADLGGLALLVQPTAPRLVGRRRYDVATLLPTQKLFHIGIVVRDRERAIGAFERLLGIDGFLRMELHTDQGLRVWIDGKPVDHHALTAFGRSGEFACELMQPLAGDGLYQRFLAAHGEGPQHCFPSILSPSDFAAARSGLERAGLGVRLEGVIGDALRYYYLDSTPLMGMCIEIIVVERPDWWQALGMTPQDAWRVGLDV